MFRICGADQLLTVTVHPATTVASRSTLERVGNKMSRSQMRCGYCNRIASAGFDHVFEFINDIPVCESCQPEIILCDECGVVVGHREQKWHDGVAFTECPYAEMDIDLCVDCDSEWADNGCPCDNCRFDREGDPNTLADMIYDERMGK